MMDAPKILKLPGPIDEKTGRPTFVSVPSEEAAASTAEAYWQMFLAVGWVGPNFGKAMAIIAVVMSTGVHYAVPTALVIWRERIREKLDLDGRTAMGGSDERAAA